MMKNRAWFLLIAFLLAGGVSSFPESVNSEKSGFKVEIVRYYFGRENIRVVVNPEKVTCETSVALNKKNYTFFERKLTDEEKRGLARFLAGFPLKEMKESYYNKGVKDGMQIRFTIRINGIKKSIYVANYYIKEFGELVSAILKLLPEDHLNYNSESVPALIEK